MPSKPKTIGTVDGVPVIESDDAPDGGITIPKGFLKSPDVAALRDAARAAAGQAAGNPQLAVITLASALELAADELEAQGRLINELMERK